MEHTLHAMVGGDQMAHEDYVKILFTYPPLVAWLLMDLFGPIPAILLA